MTPQDDMGGDAPKQMFQGSWPCSGCSATITELPFEPTRTDGLLCRDCFASKRTSGGGGGGAPKQMFQGNWKCSQCNGDITELPFEPSPDREGGLMCKDCFRNSRGPQ